MTNDRPISPEASARLSEALAEFESRMEATAEAYRRALDEVVRKLNDPPSPFAAWLNRYGVAGPSSPRKPVRGGRKPGFRPCRG